jgi:hypothetical protein
VTRPRVAALAAALATALAATGCGGGGDDKAASTPLGDALGYLPRDAASVVAIETDAQHAQWKQLNQLISKFQIAGQIRQQGKDRIARGQLDFDRDLRPQLGNELVIGSPTSTPRDKRSIVLAVKLKDPAAARRDLLPDMKSAGLEARIAEDMLVAASTREQLDAATERHDADGHLTEDDFEEDLGRLAEGEPLLRATGNLEARAEKASASGLPWPKALKTFAATGQAKPNGLAIDFDVRTDSVKAQDLPFAPGAESPPVPIREGEIAVAAREPGRTLGLVNRLRDVLPRTKAHSKALNDALDRIGVDLQRDLVAQLGENGAASFPLDRTYVARADLKDPARVAGTLKTLSDKLAGAATGDIGFTIEPGGGEGFYRLNADRGRQLFVGVVGNQIAIGEEAGRARDFAAEKTAPVRGARGSVTIAADGRSVANALIERRASGPFALLGQVLTEPIGDLRGWMETTPTGMTGHAELDVK